MKAFVSLLKSFNMDPENYYFTRIVAYNKSKASIQTRSLQTTTRRPKQAREAILSVMKT